jgi:hypothetical protein
MGTPLPSLPSVRSLEADTEVVSEGESLPLLDML